MKKREADFSITFRHWIRANPQISAPYEMKQTAKTSIAFNCIEESQINHLLACKSDKGNLMRNLGGTGESDYAYYRNSPAYIVIKIAREFHIIDIDNFIRERDRSKRKSLTSVRARDISIHSEKIVSKKT